MNTKLKGRFVGGVCSLLFAGCVAFNWYLLIHEGYFYPKISGLCPIGALFGLMLVAFPSLARGRPNRADKKSIVAPLIAGVIGLTLGGINFYLMDRYHR